MQAKIKEYAISAFQFYKKNIKTLLTNNDGNN